MKKNSNIQKTPSGFALVATLSIMILLMVIAVSILNLSAVTQKSSALSSAKDRAQANARMALMFAIGKLQSEMGQDMRISAPANILDADNPPLTGVWRSWEGSDHELTGDMIGRPIQPDYSSKQVALASDPDGRFVSWLVSGGNAASLPEEATNLVLSSSTDDTIPLLSTGSLAADDDREVHVKPIIIKDNGAYAWWVSGENQKAYIPKPYKPKNDDATGWAKHNGSYSVTDPAVFGLNTLLSDSSPSEKLITTNTAKLIADETAENMPHKSFHDLSVSSFGLLTNVATGGWRKDLSLLTERWEEQDYEGLDLFQLSPGVHREFTRPDAGVGTVGDIPQEYKKKGSVFYPWSHYLDPTNLLGDGSAGKKWPREHFHNRAAITSWASLADFATFYKKIDNADGGIPSVDKPYSWFVYSTTASPYNAYHALHSTWMVPHIAKIQLIYSHYATEDYSPTATGNLRPAVLITPVVTLWNPYNYEIKFPSNEAFRIKLGWPCQMALKYPSIRNEYWGLQRDFGGKNSPYKGKTISQNWQLNMRFRATETTPDGSPALTLGPGETRVFSPLPRNANNKPNNISYNNTTAIELQMKPGLLHEGRYLGWYIGLDELISPNLVPSGTTAEIEQQKADAYTLPPTTVLHAQSRYDFRSSVDYCGPNMQWGLSQLPHGNLNTTYHVSEAAGASSPYPPSILSDSFPVALNEIVSTPGEDPFAYPFLSMVFGSRIAAHEARATKGMVQASPAMKSANFKHNGFTPSDYPGVSSTTNSSWEYSYIFHTKGGGALPDAGAGDANGFIITGDNADYGIDRVVMIDIPVRPLTSLGQLSSWFIKGLNPLPPQTHDVIGNSDATPLIPKDNVVDPVNNPYSNRLENEQQDDSYCANHLLFDDWFFSSIAPEPTTIGPVGKTLKENYTEFLTGKDPLANRAYQHIMEDSAKDEAEAGDFYDEHVEPEESWKSIASRLEVEGMFNVNSTSVKAWRALLGHARNQKIPHQDAMGAITLSDETNYAMPRTGISGYPEAGKLIAGTLKEATEVSGYRVFTADQLDKFAEKIVEQVRLRGPFLSLSEFVNRQLSADEALAVGGAIQVALNELGKEASSSLNPFKLLQSDVVSRPSVADPPGRDDYVFRAAAEGYSAYGLPGWPRQVDVIRPLAPVLSARDDTFTVRAYGDARNADGKIEARVWCEAVVRRTRDFVGSSDASDITTPPISAVNQKFGRRFKLISFRWLNADEV